MSGIQFLEAGFWIGIIFFTYIYFFMEDIFLQLKENQFKKFLNEKKLQAEFYSWKQAQKGFWRKLE